MAKSHDSWGVEVGANAIKAVRLVRADGEVSVAEYAVVPFKQILTTPDLDVDEAIQVNLEQFLSNHDLRKSTVSVSVPGSMAFAKFAKLPPVDPKKIQDIVNFEAVQQIPFPIEQVEWDYQIFTQPESPDVEVGIFAITKERVTKFLNNYRSVGLNVDGLTLSALGVYNAMAYDMGLGTESPGMIFVDIGTTSTDVIIVVGGSIWLRTLPIGGNNFTQALIRAFKLSFQKAEKLKREAGTSKYARQIFQAMRPVFADLVQEMQRTLGYYQSLNRDAKLTKLVGFGSTFRLPGLQKFLKQQLQIDVVRPTGFKRISIEGKQAADFADHAISLATAYGLALQGLGLEQVSANILPAHIIRQRLWKSKQPWIAAAAALTVVASAAAWGRLSVDERQYDASLEASQRQVDRVVNQAKVYIKDWREIERRSDPRRRIENLRRILDYRDMWPKLTQDLILAVRSVNPQEVLYAPEYDKIRKIPVGERRRVYVESVSASYQFALDPPSESVFQSRAASEQTVEAIWGALVTDPAHAAAIPTTEGAHIPPSFVITMKGTTPHREGSKLISQHLIRWLQDHSVRADRPYRIIATRDSLVRVEKISKRPDRKPSARPGAAFGAARSGRGARGSQGATSPRRRAGDVRTELAQILPNRPDGDGDAGAGGWSFTIEWKVELVRPENARQAEVRSSKEPASVTGLPSDHPESARDDRSIASPSAPGKDSA